MLKTVIVIPARYESTRLPGKPLIEINGKPMLKYVLEAAYKTKHVDDVYVATDDDRIFCAVKDWGYKPIMTSKNHQSGTDRLIEVSQLIDADIYVNLQGDEPLINAKDVSSLIEMMRDNIDIECGSMCHEIDANEAEDINSVKVVLGKNDTALYFSRSKIPFKREETATPYYKHIGVYAYRSNLLKNYPTIENDSLELTESLEQLRLLSNGINIHLVKVQGAYPGVDTEESLFLVKNIIQNRENGNE